MPMGEADVPHVAAVTPAGAMVMVQTGVTVNATLRVPSDVVGRLRVMVDAATLNATTVEPVVMPVPEIGDPTDTPSNAETAVRIVDPAAQTALLAVTSTLVPAPPNRVNPVTVGTADTVLAAPVGMQLPVTTAPALTMPVMQGTPGTGVTAEEAIVTVAVMMPELVPSVGK